jgi:hypothetical protein
LWTPSGIRDDCRRRYALSVIAAYVYQPHQYDRERGLGRSDILVRLLVRLYSRTETGSLNSTIDAKTSSASQEDSAIV